MKYVGLYWAVFAPMMKKSIRKRFNQELADQAIRRGKAEYKGLLSRADDLGPGNPMAQNAYFAYAFAGAWLGSGKKITPDEMALVMTDVLESRLLRTIFGMTDLNKTPKSGSTTCGSMRPGTRLTEKTIPSTGSYALMKPAIRREVIIALPAAPSVNSANGRASQSSCLRSARRMR